MNEFLNIFFFVFHTLILLFNLFGWAWRRLRKWHLASLGITYFSWFVLGFWYGWGYCFCTDWHWAIRREMGFRDPPSYTQLLINEFTGLDITLFWADVLTVGGLAIATILGVGLTLRDYRLRRADRGD